MPRKPKQAPVLSVVKDEEPQARAIISTAPNCNCPTCSANDWEPTDPDDTSPPADAYRCIPCGVRHVPVGTTSLGITNFWVLRLVGANRMIASGVNLTYVTVEFEDLLSGSTDSVASASQLSKNAIGTIGDSILYDGITGSNTIVFKETGNSNIARFVIDFESLNGVKITSELVIGFKNGDVGVMFSQPTLSSLSGNDIEVNTLANQVIYGTSLSPFTSLTNYPYDFVPISGNAIPPTQFWLTQGSTNGNATYTASAALENLNHLALLSGDKFKLASQAVVVVS